MNENLKVLLLEIQHVKNIKAVRIDAEGKDLIEITGANGNGKSTVIDCISYALGGETLCPNVPIKHGEENAYIRVDLGAYEITRKWWFNTDRKLKSRLEVRGKDGVRLQAGQTILNGLLREKLIDVLEFSKLDGKKQVGILKEITGLDFASLDKERDDLYLQRKILNKEINSYKIRIDAIVLPENIPENTSLDELYKEKQKINEYNLDVERQKMQISLKEQKIETISYDITRAETSIKIALEQKEKLLASLEEAIKDRDSVSGKSQLEKKPFGEIEEKIKFAQENQEILRKARQREELSVLLADSTSKTIEANERIEEIDEEKVSMLERCEMPIKGLSFDSDQLYVNSVPFNQLSSAEEINICAAICMKYNPNFKVLYTKYASLLDDEHLTFLKRIAKKENFQLWLEKVSESPEANSIHIVDGEIKDD